MPVILHARLLRCTVAQRRNCLAQASGAILPNRVCSNRLCSRIGGIRSNAAIPTSKDTAVSTQETGNNQDRWWHVWKYRRVRLVLRMMRVGALSIALYQWGVQSGMQEYASDPRGQRQIMIDSLLSSRGVKEVKDKSSKEVQTVERVFPRILQAALEETKAQEEEAKKKLKEKGDDEDLKDELKRIKKARRMLKMWPQDGFLVLDRHDPNAFVTPSVPGIIFIHSGLFDAEHAVPVEDFCSLELDSSLYGRLKKDEKYYLPEQRKFVTFKESQLIDCSFVRNRTVDNDSYCVVKVQWRKGQKTEICIPQADIKKHWTYSIVESDDHLAMILGHELGHAIHFHGEDTIYLNVALIGLQLVLLSVLDTTGLLSMMTVLGMAPALKYSIELPFSRNQEFEADSTGLRVAARAGYQPHNAATEFERLDTFSRAYGGGDQRNWSSTHPSGEDRMERLRALETEVMPIYDAKIASMQKESSLSALKKGIISKDQKSFLSGVAASLSVVILAGCLASYS